MLIETSPPCVFVRPENPRTFLPKNNPSSTRPPVALVGICFDNVTLDQALEQIERMIESRRPHYVVTANVDFVVQAQHDVELRRILLDAHLVICDGMPLVWASRWLGNPLFERVAGADLTPLLLERAAAKNHRVFLLGATTEANEQAVENIRARFPDIEIAGHYSPPFCPLLEMDDDDIIQRVRAARPDLLLVSFGCPKAEKWIAMHYRALGVPVTIGVGATIDFLAGHMKRAPEWMQRSGVEWLYRFFQEPRRLFHRYVRDFWFFGRAMLAQWVWMNNSRRKDGLADQIQTEVVGSKWQRIRIPERLDELIVRANAPLWEQLRQRHCLMDLAGAKSFDVVGLALLMKLHLQQQRAGRQLVLLAPSAEVLKLLRLMRWEEFFAIARDAVEASRLIRAGSADDVPVIIQGPHRPLAWRGEITVCNADEVGELTNRWMQSLATRETNPCIDLSEVRFIDSAAVRLMLQAKQEAGRHGVSLHFAGAQASVRNVVQLAAAGNLLLESAA